MFHLDRLSADIQMIKNLYIHIPFCDGKCHYCGFYSVLCNTQLTDLYTPLPAKELHLALKSTRHSQQNIALETLYIGGGTPAMLGEAGLAQLVSNLKKQISFDTLKEWTVELNPASVSRSLLETLLSMGVNRVSIGVQCFDNTTLTRIGRRHSAEEAIEAIHLAQATGFQNIGIDLIAGLPGITKELWQASVHQALILPLTHLSVYALSLEPGTPLAHQVNDGLSLPDDNEQLEALAIAETLLAQSGFTRYEISNYALPGFECRHNQAVWHGEDYLGLGPAAASRLGTLRWTNEHDLEGYFDALQNERLPPRKQDTLSTNDDAMERVVFALRLIDGINLSSISKKFPCLSDRMPLWEKHFKKLHQHGITERHGDCWCLTARGREICDAVIKELF